MDLSLQVNPAIPDAIEIEQPAPEPEETVAVAVTVPKPRRKFAVRPSLHMAVAALWIVALVLLNINHKPLPRRAMGDQTTPPVVSMPAMTPVDEQSQAIDAASDQKSGDDDAEETSEAAQKISASAANQPALKSIAINELSAKSIVENAVSYFPTIAW
jgi:hypothetical protein